ncbi:MAG: pyruvate kinase [Holosporales bacterium]|jgi:pyruvate kinase|nr:pyruvate kinase [Holosporales bacterium]
MSSLRSVKIVATLGPSSNDPDTIRQLCIAGVNVFRLNFSHGTHEDHKQSVINIREAEKLSDHPIAIMLDLQGPKLRIGTFENKTVPLQIHQKFQLDLNKTPGDNTRVYFGYPEILKSLIPGTDILIDDGKVLLRVDELYEDRLIGTIQSGNEISDRKGVNLPSVCLSIDAMTPKDAEDLSFGLELGVDWVAVSFVQSADDIKRARAKVPNWIKIIAKIEKPLAIKNLNAIIDAADGIMVARGDLGVEVPLERVPGIQKQILQECHYLGKPVVVATQMLDSMVTAPTPTRAEVSDVANAVYDGADAVMLSAESASGRHPVKAVQIMDRIIRQVESDPHYLEKLRCPFEESVCSAITSAVPGIVKRSNVSAIATLASSGTTTLRLSRERPNAPIIALTSDNHIARYLCLVWGVYALQVKNLNCSSIEDWIQMVRRIILNEKVVSSGSYVLIVGGHGDAQSDFITIVDL